INPGSQTVPQMGGGGTVTVTAGPGCPWTAVSNAPWIVVTSGASGTGDGAVQFAVDPNMTGAPRVGTITIGTQTFTVNQQ
ncbi:MAG TPA: BACON domain-containing protein, partial [Vicinamibacterales bacterium]|nr:BACON domain-containing protein [Vicinamibacterales bacterium]